MLECLEVWLLYLQTTSQLMRLQTYDKYSIVGAFAVFFMLVHDNRENVCREHDAVSRTEDMHLYHLQALRGGVDAAKVYGVKKRCPLLDLPYFKVT